MVYSRTYSVETEADSKGGGRKMRAPFVKMYIHLVWATWDRLPLITTPVRARLFGAITDVCCELRCPAIAIGGMPDHVHVVALLHPTVCASELVRRIKGSSSHLVTHEIKPESCFKWQGG
jgi:REP element-mobilizing transposase RayT